MLFFIVRLRFLFWREYKQAQVSLTVLGVQREVISRAKWVLSELGQADAIEDSDVLSKRSMQNIDFWNESYEALKAVNQEAEATLKR